MINIFSRGNPRIRAYSPSCFSPLVKNFSLMVVGLIRSGLGLLPSAGPMMPFSSMASTSRAALV